MIFSKSVAIQIQYERFDYAMPQDRNNNNKKKLSQIKTDPSKRNSSEMRRGGF